MKQIRQKQQIRQHIKDWDIDEDLFHLAQAISILLKLEEFPLQKFLKWQKKDDNIK